jgi:hypothetical protein
MMLGGLEKHMFANGLSPAPTAPFIGIGYQDLVDKVRAFQPPIWFHDRNSYHQHACSPSSLGYEQLRLSTDSIVGLNIHYCVY